MGGAPTSTAPLADTDAVGPDEVRDFWARERAVRRVLEVTGVGNLLPIDA